MWRARVCLFRRHELCRYLRPADILTRAPSIHLNLSLPPSLHHRVARYGSKVLALLAFLFTLGLVLQVLGCALWDNWWPMLAGLFYVLVPMPYFFFGQSGGDDYGGEGGGSWADAGKFLTGFSAVGMVAIPAVLAHGGVITSGALALELLSACLVGGTVLAWDYFQTQGSYYLGSNW